MDPALDTLMLSLLQHGAMANAPCLFLGARPHPDLPAGVIGWQPHKGDADAWDRHGRPRLDELPADERWPMVLMLPGKSRDETLAWFAIARDHLEPGGRIVAAMPNRAGAGRFEKELRKATGSITSIHKHKCRAFHADEDGSWNEALFEPWRQLAKPRRIPDTRLVTVAGIFSSEHVDPGSELLARQLPADLGGKIADLGAGWGYLSHYLLSHCPAVESVDLYEADARALDCARHNLAHGFESHRIGFHWHDVRQGIDGHHDAIVMNPPFHSGQATDLELGHAFITTAATALRPGGRLLMVANRQLPYEAILDSLGLRWRMPAENATFKLLFADKR